VPSEVVDDEVDDLSDEGAGSK